MHNRLEFFAKSYCNVIADCHYVFCLFGHKSVLTVIEVGDQTVACKRAETLGIAFAVLVFKVAPGVLPCVKRRNRPAALVGVENTVHLIGNADCFCFGIAELFDNNFNNFCYPLGRLNSLIFLVGLYERIVVHIYGIENFAAFTVNDNSAYSRCSYINSE